MAQKRGLGKGLDALFLDNTQEEKEIKVLPITAIEPNKEQPRREFDAEMLAQLADSIQTHGVLQPLLVRPLGSDTYQIVAGERRWRASRMAGLRELPVVIREMGDDQVMQIALVENLQREDLNPIEEAMGYETLMEKHDFTQDQVAKAVGKARSGIANTLRLLQLPRQVMDMVAQGSLSQGHAKVILGVEHENEQIRLAEESVYKDISVRELEKIIRTRYKQKEPPKMEQLSYLKEVELSLAEQLGTKVKLTGTEKSGVVQLSYFSPEELDKLIKLLS